MTFLSAAPPEARQLVSPSSEEIQVHLLPLDHQLRSTCLLGVRCVALGTVILHRLPQIGKLPLLFLTGSHGREELA